MSPSIFFLVRAKPLGYRFIVYSLCITLFFTTISQIDGRSYPRFHSSSSFRFPSGHSEERLDDSPGDFIRELQSFVPYSESRSAGSSIPLSPALPQSPKNEEKYSDEHEYSGETSSSEVIKAGNSEMGDEQNNTFAKEEELRKALCPSPIGSNNAKMANEDAPVSAPSFQLRYDLHAGKCAWVGTRGHCGENMIFVGEIDSGAYGYCECDFENKIQNEEKNRAHLEEPAKPFGNTPLVFHPETKSCYRLYNQAYCNDGEWLVLNKEIKGPACEKRKCPSPSSLPISPAKGRARKSKLLTPAFWTNDTAQVSGLAKQKLNSTSHYGDNRLENFLVPINGNGPCVRLNAQNKEQCHEGEQVLFTVGDVVPKCGIPGRAIEGRAIIRNACPPGSFYSIIGRCQPDWDF